jgi:acyl-CoA ligase (AMP-forming) (exosortase A-associated)
MIRVLPDLMLASAEAVPDKAAVFHGSLSVTFGEVKRDAEALAQTLLGLGLRKSDRVGVLLEKRFEKVTSIFGLSRAGGVFVPIRKQAKADQVAHILADSGARVLIVGYAKFDTLREKLDKYPALETVIAVGNPEETSDTTLNGKVVLPWSQAVASAFVTAPANAPVAVAPALGATVSESRVSYPWPYLVETDLAAILYTSGSTGNPKGVVLNHLNLVAGARTVAQFLQINENDKLLSILTFGFDYGLNQLTTAFLCRAQIVLLDYVLPKQIIETVRKHSVTGLAAVAATWINLLQSKWDQASMPTLRYLTNSGGAIPEHYVRDLRARLPKTSVFLMYGLTEAFRSTYLDPALVDAHPTSMGKAIPGEEILILGPDHKPVAAGEIGELVHRGVLVAQGYWNAPELTAIRYRRDPMQPLEIPIPQMVVYSGDMVRIDSEGLLYFIGRNDEMIKSAGNRISPTEIEDVLYETGMVQSAVAMGIPHDIYGQSIAVVIAPKAGQEFSLEIMMDRCKAIMPVYMIPSVVEVWTTIPINGTGKLDRSLVKQRVYEKLGLKPK